MNGKRYAYVLVLIVAVIFATLAIQVYWNIKNYEDTAAQVHRDLQTALDKSVEDYYTIQAKRNTISFFNNDKEGWSSEKVGNIMSAVDFTKATKDGIVLQDSSRLTGITVVRGAQMDSINLIKNPNSISHIDIKNNIPVSKKSELNNISNTKPLRSDTLKPKRSFIETLRISDDEMKGEMQEFQNRIIFSMTSNEMNMERLDSIYKKELLQKDIAVKYQLRYNDGDSLFFEGDSLKSDFVIKSESALFYKDASLEMNYAGQAMTILKRNLTGMLLSTVLILAVISCLFYMLYVIRKQKQLSLIKNDLISNITHEFKTPIATASAALEGVQNFTISGDTEKSDRYLNVGREQLNKLNLMVEKLLETATIDSENLALQKTDLNINQLMQEAICRYENTTKKSISFNRPEVDPIIYADAFHLENAINNLIDNALKYGGDKIAVVIDTFNEHLFIKISDNGNGLKTRDARHLFEKFYRVPQGDRHNIKGHGIGLFYTRAIIEKHGGTISLNLNPTTFKIELPNE
ncbi:sensor histidine kinase [Nonlabens marinus]|uniref:histidine kinase n=1 Tax=Nonlabens marinus S1-08 TaxID=1454201 RepID=W8VPH8_9FLAO|nr:HAMP domain-containing sensor histidine kinase [Nonlabens marinus]BAO54495.1 two-component system sensor histidine kinase [Nonlabens marinus S1-08]